MSWSVAAVAAYERSGTVVATLAPRMLPAQEAVSALPAPVTRSLYRAHWFEFLNAHLEDDARGAAAALAAPAAWYLKPVPDQPLRQFLYMPFMHSEHLADQLRCIELSREAGLAESAKWAEHHAEIIRRFGRFPHRNRLLGRPTTPEEQAFLDEGGFSP